MGVSTLLTFAEFEQLPEDEYKHELLEGEHVVCPPPGIEHSDYQHWIRDALVPHVQGRGRVYVEAGYQLGRRTWLQPDVSFATNEHRKKVTGKYLEGAPLLAVEVISESNTAREIDRKIGLFFEHGSEEIWVVYPDSRSIWVHRRGESGATKHTEEIRTLIFPELRLDVKALFDPS